MPSPIKTAKEIFLEAADLAEPSSRARYLNEACAGDADLRRHVEALLRAHDEPDSLLDQERIPAPIVIDREVSRPTIDQPQERPGTQIGPYKLLQQIGEGGMGVVYMAEQHEPVKRRVALKIIKPGMDTRQVIARFEAERQALSLMDHPNIAKVLDAGMTESGRPYFVMELVKGQPITQYCDEKHLTPRQRLELLLPVCQAIQHAHTKGIIHRDIKPTNILVAEYDQQPVPKVIDFGVAKATSQTLTEKTMFTGLGQIVGTLEYMSPEQAKVNQLDIDTRSDIYSLGVLLYELLTGSTPFDKKRLRSAAFDEMLRIIREEEPPKPSTRLSESSDSLPSISVQRHTEPAKLTKLVRGELDWIAMKALEKDRNRRYETANGFAADLQRYLADEPVQACPPSAIYRFGKFVRRNKVAVFGVSAAFAALLLLVFGLVISNRMIAAERNEKARALTETEQAMALAEAQHQLAVYVDAVEHPRISPESAGIDELYREVSEQLKRAENPPDKLRRLGAVQIWWNIGHRQRDLAFLLRNAGRLEHSEQTFQKAVSVFEKLRDLDPNIVAHWQFLADSHYQIGLIKLDRNNSKEAEQAFRRAIEIHEQCLSRFPTPDVAGTWSGRGHCYLALSEFDKAVEDFSAALKLKPDLWEAWGGRAAAHFHLQHWDEAVSDYSRAIELWPHVHTHWFHRGHIYLRLAQWEKAAADFTKVVEGWPQEAGGWYLRSLAHAQLNQPEKALSDLRQAVEKGFTDVNQLKNNPKLAPLRDREDFGKLLKELEQRKK